uniref:Uncharacterized protein n=1 Tax=Arundo donax TaxID=35708 RepID=A0A0A8Y3V5_ARUDO
MIYIMAMLIFFVLMVLCSCYLKRNDSAM